MICCKCLVRMKLKKFGVMVQISPNQLRSGDVFECPSCKTRVLSSMGAPYTGTLPEILHKDIGAVDMVKGFVKI